MNNPLPVVVLAGLVSGVATTVVVMVLAPAGLTPAAATGEAIGAEQSDDIERMKGDVEIPRAAKMSRVRVKDPMDGVIPENLSLIPQNWPAINAVLEERPWGATLKGWTVAQLVRQLGYPSKVEKSENSGALSLMYNPPDSDNVYLYFKFEAGRLTGLSSLIW